MRPVSLGYTHFIASLILVLTCIAFLTNYFIYNFQGNNFFPDNVPALALILIIFNIGLHVSFENDSYPRQAGRELIYFFTVMSLIALATNAIQLTPFSTIDHHILSFELRLNINMNSILLWTSNHPHFKQILAYIYDTLPYQMCFIPILVIATGKFSLIKDYYFLLLISTLLGFCFYYFFPTTAPASIIDSSFFSFAQIATGLKFYQIHHYILPTTNEGGLIALPSFHVIWAILCVYLLKDWVILCVLLSLINLLLIFSCVLLGWHYPTDILGGILIVCISFYFLKKVKAKQQYFASS